MTRTAIVTGGTRGLGLAIAIALKREGHRVAAVYRSDDAAARHVTETWALPTYKWDVADFAACEEGIRRVEAELGPVGILVNNAGITRDAALHHMTPDQWWSVIRVNLGSMYNMCRHVIDGMRARHFGRIVNISSLNGQKGQFGQTNYAASKAGVLGFTKALALEGAHCNVTANAIAPGYCETEMLAAVPPDILKTIVASIPVGRLGTPEDIARAVVFLTRDDAAYVTGTTLSVNGGQLMS